ncbi:MAG: nicotinamide mononucleotide transporter [Ruminococcus sp.]|nr:nicotinamide mononucleotide transporter [Ruminococcus sp.]
MINRLFRGSFSRLTRFEVALWLSSAAVVIISGIASGFISGRWDMFSLSASLVGVTALIFVAKGHALGQLLTVVFGLLYGFISLKQRYYGEMITYLGMTSPMAVFSLISWLRHPYGDTAEAEVSRLSSRQKLLLPAAAAAVTAVFYFILRAMGNASLAVSTVSITTSFAASMLTFWRSPYYALAYAGNDVVLIILWTIAAFHDPSACIPVIACFLMFLLNDIYGFISWRRRQTEQAG